MTAKIYVCEPGTTGGVGAMGIKMLIGALRKRHHEVTRVRLWRKELEAHKQLALIPGLHDHNAPSARHLPRPDAWYCSVLHVRQYADVAEMRLPLVTA